MTSSIAHAVAAPRPRPARAELPAVAAVVGLAIVIGLIVSHSRGGGEDGRPAIDTMGDDLGWKRGRGVGVVVVVRRRL